MLIRFFADKFTFSSMAYVLACGLLITAGCGVDEATQAPTCEPLSAVVNNDGTSNAVVVPTQIFTGVNGRDLYRAVVVTSFGDLTLTSSNEQIASVEPFGCLQPGALGITGVVTAEGQGDATITVNSGQFSRNIPVSVAGYTPEQYDLGLERYDNPANPSPARTGCADCHSEAGGAPHDPVALGGFSDQELISATTLGQYPDKCIQPTGLSCNCTPVGEDPQMACAACPEADCRFSDGFVLDLDRTNTVADAHVFELTPEEEAGVMAYMRAIPPEGL